MSGLPSLPEEASFRAQILEAARAQVRRFGEAKTNVVDIARALGTSHTTIYRHFRTKADVFDAVVQEAMRDEEQSALRFVETDGSAAERLEGMVLALHQSKRSRFADDPEVYGLYRRVVEERPELVIAYARLMTGLIERILADGVRHGEFRIDDLTAAAGVVRDAVTTFVHPALVETAIRNGAPAEALLRNVVRSLITAFRCGVTYGDG